MNPIHGLDLAAACVAAIGQSTREIAAGGPEIFTHHEMAALALDVMGKEVKITHLPDWLRACILTPFKGFCQQQNLWPGRIWPYGDINGYDSSQIRAAYTKRIF